MGGPINHSLFMLPRLSTAHRQRPYATSHKANAAGDILFHHRNLPVYSHKDRHQSERWNLLAQPEKIVIQSLTAIKPVQDQNFAMALVPV